MTGGPETRTLTGLLAHARSCPHICHLDIHVSCEWLDAALYYQTLIEGLGSGLRLKLTRSSRQIGGWIVIVGKPDCDHAMLAGIL